MSSPNAESMTGRVIALAGDHAGFALKREIAAAIEALGASIKDFGPASAAPCDYPDHVIPAALALSRGEVWRAIFIDGAGYPSGILANKCPGVYAAVANDAFSARLCREHSNANALCIGGQVIGPAVAKELVTIFLKTAFLGGKYQGRVDKVLAAEAKVQPRNADAEPLRIIAVEDVRRALRERRHLLIDPAAKLTPSAEDLIR